MRLPWHRTRVPPQAIEDAEAAVAAADEHLALVKEREPEVRAVVDRLRELRQSNHFSERLAEMLAEQPRGGHRAHGD